MQDENYLTDLALLLAHLNPTHVERATNILVATTRSRGTIYVVGNGGCAAIASHFAADCPGRVVSLVDGIPNLTRIANDVGYEDIFAMQLQEHGMDSLDALLAMSVSGDSANVLRVANYANRHGGNVIAFVGNGGANLAELAQAAVIVPSNEYELVEDVFGALCHLVAREMR